MAIPVTEPSADGSAHAVAYHHALDYARANGFSEPDAVHYASAYADAYARPEPDSDRIARRLRRYVQPGAELDDRPDLGDHVVPHG